MGRHQGPVENHRDLGFIVRQNLNWAEKLSDLFQKKPNNYCPNNAVFSVSQKF